MIALIIIGLLIIIFSFTILTVAGRHYVKNGDSYEQKRGAFMKKLRHPDYRLYGGWCSPYMGTN